MTVRESENSLHFLVVDDDAESRSTIVEYLRTMGFNRVTLAHDGTEAIRLLDRDSTINFIISDWEMPLMNGFSLLQRIKTNVDRAEIPFLLMTSPVSEEAEKIVLAAENLVDGYLIKPFRSQILQEKIKKVLTVASLGHKKQVVLVDDDNDARDMIVEYVKQMGFKDVMTFSDGMSALKYVNENSSKVGLIVSDWEMPHMTGLDFLRACKGEKALADIPFLMITSQTSVERMKVLQAARANVDQYMLKPFKATDFQKRIEEVLDKAKAFPEVRKLLAEGTEHFENGRLKNALSKFEDVLRIHPENDVALRNIAEILSKEKDHQAALPYYKRAIEANPVYAKTYLKLAVAYEQLGWPDRALALLQTANERIGFNPDLHFALGKLYHRKGLNEQARLEFEKTLEMQVDHQEAKIMLEVLNLHRKGS